jgi:ABC-type uncharacterized transport system fused permease/ATPase subunit
LRGKELQRDFRRALVRQISQTYFQRQFSKKTRHKTTNHNAKKHTQNIRADLSAAKASAMSLDS